MSKIYMMGDVHGSHKPIRDFYNYLIKKPQEGDVLIMLGDFGGNFYLDGRDDTFKKKLARFGFTYFVIRGNHEQRPSILYNTNPNKWHIETFFGSSVYVENEYPYIKYAADTSFQYNIQEHSTLVLPGAYSVDKYYRLKMGWHWYESEQLNDIEMDIGRMIVEAVPNWDLVLSHTCPVIYEPTDLFLKQVDQSMVDKTMERYLGEIENKIEYGLWGWGHYHNTRVYPRFTEDINYPKDRIMLFGNKILDLTKYWETKNLYDSLEVVFPD